MLKLVNISKSFSYHFKKYSVLKNINLNIEKGEIVALMGKSGSGKTTLLNIISGLLKPSGGKIYFNNKKIIQLDFFLSKYRNKNIGFVFQNFNLIEYLTILDNVIMPLKFSISSPLNQKKIGLYILEKVGLKEKANHYPRMLSGGQLQRCAIARALINKPSLIIADEPTGNLDNETAKEILEIFKKLNQEDNITFLIATHEKGVVNLSTKVLYLQNGELTEYLPENIWSNQFENSNSKNIV